MSPLPYTLLPRIKRLEMVEGTLIETSSVNWTQSFRPKRPCFVRKKVMSDAPLPKSEAFNPSSFNIFLINFDLFQVQNCEQTTTFYVNVHKKLNM